MIKKKDILVLSLSFHTQKELQFASFLSEFRVYKWEPLIIQSFVSRFYLK